jgi:hypothetical protein
LGAGWSTTTVPSRKILQPPGTGLGNADDLKQVDFRADAKRDLPPSTYVIQLIGGPLRGIGRRVPGARSIELEHHVPLGRGRWGLVGGHARRGRSVVRQHLGAEVGCHADGVAVERLPPDVALRAGLWSGPGVRVFIGARRRVLLGDRRPDIRCDTDGVTGPRLAPHEALDARVGSVRLCLRRRRDGDDRERREERQNYRIPCCVCHHASPKLRPDGARPGI